jgi:alpha-L-rhamnosidase
MPCDMRVEFRDRPCGLHHPAPRLGWAVRDASPGWRQGAYRIRVASTAELLAQGVADCWDSGRVQSSQSAQVEYAGVPLRSRQRCHWRVDVWDDDGRPCAPGETSYWEMGLLQAEDWKAQWIGAALEETAAGAGALDASCWIWSRSLALLLLRRSFHISGQLPQRATLDLQVDTAVEVFLNGVAIARQSSGSLQQHDLLGQLRLGENVLALRCLQSATPFAFAAGLRAVCRLQRTDGTDAGFVSDGLWRQPPIREALNLPRDPNGPWRMYPQFAKDHAWMRPGFDDATWVPPHFRHRLHPRELRRSQYLRRTFRLAAPVASARLYASASGAYQLHLNGARICRDPVKPGRTDRVRHYQVYDVAAALRVGDNALGAIVGGGWWGGHGHQDCEPHTPRLLAQLEVLMQDGSNVVIASDGDWRSYPSPYVEDSLAFGVRYDARLEEDGWAEPDYDDQAWSAVACTATLPDGLPLIGQPFAGVIEWELPPRQLRPLASGRWLADFGSNVAGRIRLRLHDAPPGQAILVRYAEAVDPDGTPWTEAYRDVFNPRDEAADRSPGILRNLDAYWCRGGDAETFAPDFTYTGARYVVLEGLPTVPAPADLALRVMHNDLPAAGSFACSNELLNRIWRTSLATFTGNLMGGPTDCPTREKEYYDDLQTFLPSACWAFDLSSMIPAWLRHCPRWNGGDACGWAGWDDGKIIQPWTLHRFYGDQRVLEENWDDMLALVAARSRHVQDGIYRSPGFEYGDHCAVVETDLAFHCAAYHCYSVQLLGRIADRLGRTAEARRWATESEALAAALSRRWLDDPAWLAAASQTALLMPIGFNLLPADDPRRERLLAALLADLEHRDWHPSTGFIGTAMLLPVLSASGHHAEALRIATSTTPPSWGAMLAAGATTWWEGWSRYHNPGSIQSQNHFALGSIAAWLVEHLVGMTPDPERPGFAGVRLRPGIIAGIDQAEASYRSSYGIHRLSWRRTADGIRVEVDVPANTEARLILPSAERGPAAEQTLGSGSHAALCRVSRSETCG